MRRLLFRVVGLCLTPVLGLALVHGSELANGPTKTGPKVQPAATPKPIVEDKAKGTCGQFGTTVEFVSTPSKAARIAKKEEKLVFVLHVSGIFEEPRFT